MVKTAHPQTLPSDDMKLLAQRVYKLPHHFHFTSESFDDFHYATLDILGYRFTLFIGK